MFSYINYILNDTAKITIQQIVERCGFGARVHGHHNKAQELNVEC